ncbi:hypothetical protein RV13_GL003739 [Enterococcus raffinosus]|nr:hypothetical protein RV13_GL003739 [Enterococcus raffinosus]
MKVDLKIRARVLFWARFICESLSFAKKMTRIIQKFAVNCYTI